MRIIRFKVEGLLERDDPVQAHLHPDLNILTGKNGAGKTNLLKLLWYTVSGNILLALQEVVFSELEIETDQYEIKVTRVGPASCRISYIFEDKDFEFVDQHDEFGEFAEDMANEQLREIGASVFLPTFRRIEGGFGLKTRARRAAGLAQRTRGEVEEALSELSRGLSHSAHTFVSSISTSDVNALLLRKYADLSDQS